MPPDKRQLEEGELEDGELPDEQVGILAGTSIDHQATAEELGADTNLVCRSLERLS
jgi:hypothetical protein